MNSWYPGSLQPHTVYAHLCATHELRKFMDGRHLGGTLINHGLSTDRKHQDPPFGAAGTELVATKDHEFPCTPAVAFFSLCRWTPKYAIRCSTPLIEEPPEGMATTCTPFGRVRHRWTVITEGFCQDQCLFIKMNSLIFNSVCPCDFNVHAYYKCIYYVPFIFHKFLSNAYSYYSNYYSFSLIY